MRGDGKLGKVIKEALDENSNPFLTLAYGSVYGETFAFSYLKKNYPLLLKMYNNYIKLDQCKDEYVKKKIKRHCKSILSTLQNETLGRFYLLRCNDRRFFDRRFFEINFKNKFLCFHYFK